MTNKTLSQEQALSNLFASPDLYVQDMNWQSGNAKCLRMSRESYSASTFLDHRTIASDDRVETVPIAELMRAWREQAPVPKPLRIIAHTALCGSTLLCRCLDLPGLCLPYREPALLHNLSGIWQLGLQHKLQARLPAAQPSIMDLAVALNSRSYSPAERPVIKLTDSCTSLLPTLLAHYRDSRMLLLYSDLESFLVAMLRSPERREYARNMLTRARLDLSAVGMAQIWPDERTGEPPGELPGQLLSDGRAVALIWLSLMYPFLRLLLSVPQNVRSLRSDVFFAAPLQTLDSLDRFFALDIGEDRLQAHLDTGVLSQHAKDAANPFDIEQRKARDAHAASRFGEEIADAVQWVETITVDAPIPAPLPGAL